MGEVVLSRRRRVALLVNGRSRTGQKLFAEAKRRLLERDIELISAEALHDPSTLPGRIAQAVAAKAELVIVGGGDGSISCAAGALRGSGAALGVLPFGTANSFARTLDVPPDLGGALGVALDGKAVDVDIGSIDGRCFANAAAIGLPARIGEDIPHGLKAALGRLGYFLFALWCLARFKGFRATITVDGEAHSFEASEIRVHNGSYLGGIEVAEEASVESLDLLLQVVTGHSRWGLARAWLSGGFGQRARHIETLRGCDIRIETSPSWPVSVDGEVLAHTPVEAKVLRQALRVMVPVGRDDLD